MLRLRSLGADSGVTYLVLPSNGTSGNYIALGQVKRRITDGKKIHNRLEPGRCTVTEALLSTYSSCGSDFLLVFEHENVMFDEKSPDKSSK